MLPTAFYGNQKQPLNDSWKVGRVSFFFGALGLGHLDLFGLQKPKDSWTFESFLVENGVVCVCVPHF